MNKGVIDWDAHSEWVFNAGIKEGLYRLILGSSINMFICMVCGATSSIFEDAVKTSDTNVALLLLVGCFLVLANTLYWLIGLNLFDYKKLFRRERK